MFVSVTMHKHHGVTNYHWFLDSSKRLEQYFGILRSMRGGDLNFNVQGSYSVVRDQYFLKLDDATSTEIITGQTQLKSAYNFFVSMGINYSFGSIYNNVVNVRFQGIY
jgi:hypothetical protein